MSDLTDRGLLTAILAGLLAAPALAPEALYAVGHTGTIGEPLDASLRGAAIIARRLVALAEVPPSEPIT